VKAVVNVFALNVVLSVGAVAFVERLKCSFVIGAVPVLVSADR
jgi:hypothetical protein